MMKVIAGLGNPGPQYANTPHSIGFETVDALARGVGAAWRPVAGFQGEIASATVGSQKVLLVKPQTFMNSSGDCIAPVLRYHNATVQDLLVVSDDIDLPVGKMRLRKGGSAGGHNGLKSIIERTGSPDFVRLRIGVGRRTHDRGAVIGHVLGKVAPQDRAVLDEVVPEAVKAVETVITQNLETAMNRYNGWSASAAAAQAGEGNT